MANGQLYKNSVEHACPEVSSDDALALLRFVVDQVDIYFRIIMKKTWIDRQNAEAAVQACQNMMDSQLP